MRTLRNVTLLTCVLGLFAFGLLIASGHAEIPQSAVVGIWLLDSIDGDTARDSSGNGHDGTVNGGPELVDGNFGNAVRFDGTDDFIDCGTAESLNLGSFSVSFWARVPATQGWNHMVSKGSHVGSGTPGSVNWGVMMRSGEARFLYEIFEDTSWTGISGPEVPLDEWQHLVATYDGDNMEFFLNGESLGSSAGVTVELDASRSFRIGAIATAGATPGNFFNGSLDEVGLFSDVLGPEDIQAIMNDGLLTALGITSAVTSAGKSATTWAEIKNRY